MFHLRTYKIIRTRKKNIGSFLAILFCTLIIVSTVGNSFVIRNSLAQVQQQQQQSQTRQAPTIAYQSPWSNNLQVSSASNSQPLCKAGICNQSSGPASTTQTTSAQPTTTQPQSTTTTTSSAITPTTSADPTATVFPASTTQTTNLDPTHTNTHASQSLTATNNKPLTLAHQFISNKVVGPDRFRFINYYWTTSATQRAIDVGSSSSGPLGGLGALNGLGPLAGTGTGPLSALPQGPNTKEEVDTNEGQNTLAVQLQYQGVVPLAGVTAALKLPAGFRAATPLTDDPHRYDISLSNYRGTIVPGQGIVLYFTLFILPTAQVGLPVLGPVALHFLRADSRIINDNMEAIPVNILNKVFSDTTNIGNPLAACGSSTTAGNCTTTTLGPFTHSFDFRRDYLGQFGRFIPFDFINQVIPVIFKVTGQETLDVVTLPYGAPVSLDAISTHLVKIPSGDTSRVRLAVTNTGDAPVYDMTVNVFPPLQSGLGINGLNPSVVSSPNIPATLFSTIFPIGIAGHSTFYLGNIPANGIKEFDVNVYPTHYVAGTVELLNVQLTYNNVVGTRVITGSNTPSSVGGSAVCNPTGAFAACGAPTLNQVYFVVTPTP